MFAWDSLCLVNMVLRKLAEGRSCPDHFHPFWHTLAISGEWCPFRWLGEGPDGGSAGSIDEGQGAGWKCY